MRSYASAEINTHVCLCVHPGYMWFCRQTHSPQRPPLLSPELLPETQHRAQWWEWKGQQCPSWRAGEGQVGKSARARSIIAADSRQGAWPAKDKREGRVCAGQEGSHRADAWATPPGIWAGPWIEVPRAERCQEHPPRKDDSGQRWVTSQGLASRTVSHWVGRACRQEGVNRREAQGASGGPARALAHPQGQGCWGSGAPPLCQLPRKGWPRVPGLGNDRWHCSLRVFHFTVPSPLGFGIVAWCLKCKQWWGAGDPRLRWLLSYCALWAPAFLPQVRPRRVTFLPPWSAVRGSRKASNPWYLAQSKYSKAFFD